jgi:hypothetical protein
VFCHVCQVCRLHSMLCCVAVGRDVWARWYLTYIVMCLVFSISGLCFRAGCTQGWYAARM